MRVLCATAATNGTVMGDYHSCVEGELVYMQDPCAMDERDPDGPCGCARAFAGLNSHRATTTALVVDLPLTEADVREALRSSLEAGGWLDPDLHTQGSAEAMLQQTLADVRQVAEYFPQGTVVRRRLSRYAAHGSA